MADKPQSEVQKWLDIVSQYDTEFKKWEARVTKILKRYRDDNRTSGNNDAAKFNILWANVQTLIPAVYAKLPRADVSRRFGDNDPVGRVASLLIERALDYEIEHYPDFRSCMRHSVEDRFLGGRGVGWVRYDPHVQTQEIEITDNKTEGEGAEDRTAGEDEPPEEIAYECSPTDYVHWKDFGHSSARIWEEVGQVWRWVYLTDEAGKNRFKDKWVGVPLDSGPDPLNRTNQKDDKNRAKICELWDRETGKVVWFSKGKPTLLDERADPLELEGFFPCARPLYATTTSDNLVPVPDFVLYQDQANDLDILSDRIDGLIKALRVRGVYNSSIPVLQRLLTEGDNNTLLPCEQWGAFSEKGGLKGSIDLLPLDVIAAALLQCYQAETNIKSTIYEITGISDIIRGQGRASETATAQQIKGQYAGLRLKSMQESVALFASELLQIKAQVICSKYQPETILSYAAADQMAEADQELIPQAIELIKQSNSILRTFRIEVASDSLVQIDEVQNKQDRLDFINSFSNYMREAVPAGQSVPEMVPVIMAIAKYLVGGFKQARSIEGTIDTALQQLEVKAQQAAANPQPHPEQVKAQAKAAADAQAAQVQGQIDQQIESVRAQSAQAVEQIRAQAEENRLAQENQHEMAMRAMELHMEQQFEAWAAKLKAETSIEVANIAATASTDVAETSAETQLAATFANGGGSEVNNNANT